MSRRKRGRITMQYQPTGAARGMQRMIGVIHALVGSVFVIISITTIIPNAGLFGLIFLVVGGLFAINGILMAVSKNGMAQRVAYDVEQDLEESIVGMMEEPPLVGESPEKGSVESRLLELRSLYDQRLITDEEYELKRQEILRDL